MALIFSPFLFIFFFSFYLRKSTAIFKDMKIQTDFEGDDLADDNTIV